MFYYVIKNEKGEYFNGEYKNGKPKFSKNDCELHTNENNARLSATLSLLQNYKIIKVKLKIIELEDKGE